ncbi:ATP-binding protein [Alteromonas sp. ZYF713]|nr:ATP-binding protein [Alteromonas sp. ZYF713]
MLIYFSAKNYRSINETVELNLRSNNRLRHHKDHVKFPLGDEKKVGVLKAAAIYGANAAGKSNIIKAIREAVGMIDGIYKPSKNLHHKPFKLSQESLKDPTEFYFEFALHGHRYSYTFKYNATAVLYEELVTHNSDTNYTTIYERTYEGTKNVIRSDLFTDLGSEYLSELLSDTKSSSIDKGDLPAIFRLLKEQIENRSILERTPKDKLIISEVSTRNIDISENPAFRLISYVKEYLGSKIQCISPNSRFHGIHNEIENYSDKKSSLASIMNSFDTGISDIKLNDISTDNFDADLLKKVKSDLNEGSDSSIFKIIGNKYVVFILDHDGNLKARTINTVHNDQDGKPCLFDIRDESDGSQRLMDLLPIMSKNATFDHMPFTFIIDEFNQSLHPKLAIKFITKFFELTAESETQLIVSTHESELLNNKILRRDEIFFAQKHDDGSTSLYNLDEYSTRYDKDLRKAYLSGKFGAIPQVK